MNKSADSHTTSTAPVLVAGPLFLDVVMGPLSALPEPGQEQWVPGCTFAAGGAANQAVALARLGVPTTLCSYIGADQPGQLTRSLLAAEGVDLSGLVEAAHQSVTVSLSLAQDRAMVTCGSDRAPLLSPTPNPPAALLADLTAIGANRGVIASWRDQSPDLLVIADVGWDPTGQWDPSILQHLDLVDIFVPNEVEALNYTGAPSVEAAAEQLAGHHRSVVVTRGAKGAYAWTHNRGRLVPSPTVETVDPTGAGDTFTAGLTRALLRGEDIFEACHHANLAAAWSVQSLGGSVSAPYPEDLDRLQHRRNHGLRAAEADRQQR